MLSRDAATAGPGLAGRDHAVLGRRLQRHGRRARLHHPGHRRLPAGAARRGRAAGAAAAAGRASAALALALGLGRHRRRGRRHALADGPLGGHVARRPGRRRRAAELGALLRRDHRPPGAARAHHGAAHGRPGGRLRRRRPDHPLRPRRRGLGLGADRRLRPDADRRGRLRVRRAGHALRLPQGARRRRAGLLRRAVRVRRRAADPLRALLGRPRVDGLGERRPLVVADLPGPRRAGRRVHLLHARARPLARLARLRLDVPGAGRRGGHRGPARQPPGGADDARHPGRDRGRRHRQPAAGRGARARAEDALPERTVA